MNKRITQIALLCFLGVLIGTVSAWFQVREDNGAIAAASIEPASGAALAGADIGGSFTLTDHNGNIVTEKSFGDSYRLMFFGFTFCPDVCPTELQKISTALNLLGPDAEKVQPLFVTIDPERDTPEVMRAYVKEFHPRLIGLTGTLEQIKQIEDNYKVYAAKLNDPAFSDYTMNHSSFTFLMSPGNKPLSLFSSTDSPDDIAAEIKRVMQTH